MFNTENATVEQWLERLEALHPTEIDLGLDRVKTVGQRLNCLKPAPLVIMVGGTNGKGTTSALLAALLRAQGLRVGVYNSPHIRRYNERVSINGEQISDADLCHSFRMVEAVRNDTSLTYFEFGTLAALAWFQHAQVDAVVLEIGLGGRLDAVNIVDADLSVVSSIGLDHQSWLGDTVEEIAYEKFSIARPHKWIVNGQPRPPHTAQKTAEAIGAKWAGRDELFFVEQHLSEQGQVDGLTVRFQLNEQRTTWQLPVAHIPYHNVATAIQALALIKRLPSYDVVAQCVAELRVDGRLQTYKKTSAAGELWVTLDVAHNEQAAAYIGRQLIAVDGIILGMLADKDADSVAKVLPEAKQLILVGLPGYRGLSAEQLAAKAHFKIQPQLAENVAAAMAVLPSSGRWLICGSFYTVEAAMDVINGDDAWIKI